jgi:hypothetical protein
MIRLRLVVMRRTLLTLAILGLVWIGYIAWPVYDLFVLIRAIETRDDNTVVRHVYFDAVRLSLTNQVVDAYLPRTGIQIGPLRRWPCQYWAGYTTNISEREFPTGTAG